MPRPTHKTVSLREADYELAHELSYHCRVTFTRLLAVGLRLVQEDTDEFPSDRAGRMRELLEEYGVD